MPSGIYLRPSAEERFWSKVNKTDTCWLWKASKNGYGYGKFWHNGKHQGAHRVAYEFIIGEIPKGLHIDHLCRVRHCVNPSHLEPVTQRENNLRGEGLAAICANKTHCKNGHPFSGDNLYIRLGGGRDCKICKGIRIRKWYKKQLEKTNSLEGLAYVK